MSKAATLHAHQFSWDRSMETLLDRMYRDLLADRASLVLEHKLAPAALPQAA
jgi:hypothetical protein